MCEMCLKEKCQWKCLDCKTFLCQNCKTLHFRLPMCRGHQVVKAEDEGKFAIDRLVFCEKHTDQAIILNCRDCEEPLCIKCKVTKHEAHKTETVEDTLERILPEMEIHSEKIKLLLTDIDNNKDELDAKKLEVKASFDKCRKDGENKLQQIIDTATEDYNALVKELDIREEQELEKLRVDKRKELESLLDWMKTCNETARGVTLMEQVQSGLGRRMKQIAEITIIEKSLDRLKLPSLVINEGKSSGEGNVIGKIQYDSSRILKKEKLIDYRNPDMPFKEMLKRDFKIDKEVPLKGRCTRISMVCGDIWAAISDKNCIQVIDIDGNVKHDIACAFQPYSVKEAPWGDIIVAGTTGLFCMLPDGKIDVTISNDSFCDLSFFEDEILGLNRTKQILQSFCKSDDGKWKHNGDIEGSQGTGKYSEESVVTSEQNVIFTMNGINTSKFYSCKGKTGKRLDFSSNLQPMSYPFVCGVDSTDGVLVADCSNEQFQLLDAVQTWSVFKTPCIALQNPFDFLYHAESDKICVLLFNNGPSVLKFSWYKNSTA